MIFDHVSNLKLYTGIPGMAEILRFLEDNPPETLQCVRYELPGACGAPSASPI